jgi:hypothetical protein
MPKKANKNNEWLNAHKGIMIPREAHEWLSKRQGEILMETGARVSMGEVLLDAIRALEIYEKQGEVMKL